MIKKDEKIVMKAIALCFKKNLKPEEAFIYCDLERTQFAKRCAEMGVTKNEAGYYSREDLDKMCTQKQIDVQGIVGMLRSKKKMY